MQAVQWRDFTVPQQLKMVGSRYLQHLENSVLVAEFALNLYMVAMYAYRELEA